MGNAIFYCLVHPATTVRVMQANGEVLEFDRPLIAKQLMKVYPGHLVVHCSQVSRSSGLGQRSKVLMLRADDALQLGQTYCLLRVPSQRAKVLTQTGMKAPTSDRDIDSIQLEEELQDRLPPLPALQHQPFGGPWRPCLDAIIESPLNMSSRPHGVAMSPLARQAGYTPLMSPLRPSSSAHPADS